MMAACTSAACRLLRGTDHGIAERAGDPVAFTFLDVPKVVLLKAALHIIRLVLQFCRCLDPVAGRRDTLGIGLVERQPLNFRERRFPGGAVLENRPYFRRRIEPELFAVCASEGL